MFLVEQKESFTAYAGPTPDDDLLDIILKPGDQFEIVQIENGNLTIIIHPPHNSPEIFFQPWSLPNISPFNEEKFAQRLKRFPENSSVLSQNEKLLILSALDEQKSTLPQAIIDALVSLLGPYTEF